MKSLQDFLVLILSGILEGVVDERSSGGPHFSHQVRGLINFIFKKYPTRKILQSQLQRPNKKFEHFAEYTAFLCTFVCSNESCVPSYYKMYRADEMQWRKWYLLFEQLGRCIIAAGVDAQASANGAQTGERLPFVCAMGPGAVVGAGLFLAHMDTMKYRARTTVRSGTPPKGLPRLLNLRQKERPRRALGLDSHMVGSTTATMPQLCLLSSCCSTMFLHIACQISFLGPKKRAEWSCVILFCKPGGGCLGRSAGFFQAKQPLQAAISLAKVPLIHHGYSRAPGPNPDKLLYSLSCDACDCSFAASTTSAQSFRADMWCAPYGSKSADPHEDGHELWSCSGRPKGIWACRVLPRTGHQNCNTALACSGD